MVVSITRAVVRIINHHVVVKHALIEVGKAKPGLIASVLRLQLQGICELSKCSIEVIHEEEVYTEAIVRLVGSRLLSKPCIEDFARFQ